MAKQSFQFPEGVIPFYCIHYLLKCIFTFETNYEFDAGQFKKNDKKAKLS